MLCDFIKSLWQESTTVAKVMFLVIMIGTMITAVVTEISKLTNYDVLTIMFAGIAAAIGAGIAIIIFGVIFGILFIALKE